ncbi:amidohydrolase family protein [Reichenbachiella sp. MALMAid0571]|uniref:amidohydrolase family protein n=1 Tax=Reichenbachiella sp. MALMAid0571 TaxID=3143939 RepID=UPI0032DFC963
MRKNRVSKKYIVVVVFMLGMLKVSAQSKMEYLNSIKKIDVHTHVRSDQPFLRELLDELNYKFCTLSTIGTNSKTLLAQIDTAKMVYEKYPRYYAWVTTFDVSNRDEPGWTDQVINQLKNDFENGAVGVKVWKAIGMEFKKPNGEYLQLDDPIFEPIFTFIAQQGKTLIAHMGEPIQAWMPTYFTEGGKPRNYWAKHPEFSFWDKPEKPSYSDIMAARDHVIERHPNLRFVGAHLASLEFDVDEIITRMEQYPNFAVEIGGRTRYLMWQARGKVLDFFTRYQDRIMYGTDKGAKPKMTPEDIENAKEEIIYRNQLFHTYYATADEIPWGNIVESDRPLPEPSYNVKGLDLPREILDKVFYKNAVKWFPGIEKEYQ